MNILFHYRGPTGSLILMIAPEYSSPAFHRSQEGQECFYRGKINQRHFKGRNPEKIKEKGKKESYFSDMTDFFKKPKQFHFTLRLIPCFML